MRPRPVLRCTLLVLRCYGETDIRSRKALLALAGLWWPSIREEEQSSEVHDVSGEDYRPLFVDRVGVLASESVWVLK